MKSMTRLTIAAVLLGTILLLGSCNEIKLKGRQVTFRASTGEVGTKTAYGDDVDNSGTTWQFIDWVDDDLLRIVSNKALGPSGENYADYVVTNTGRNGHQCNGKITPMPNGLTWTGQGNGYDFYAVYPSPETVGSDVWIDSENDYGDVVATLPNALTLSSGSTKKYLKSDGTATTADDTDNIAYTYDVFAPDMTKAVMTAVAPDVSEDSEVSLVFKPAFTAFEFNMTSKDENFTVTKVELLSIKQGTNGKWEEDDSDNSDILSGKFLMKAGDEDFTTVDPQDPDVSNKVTVTMNQELTSASGVTFTIFTLPVANNNMLGLRVTTNSGVATLPLTKSQSTEAYVFAPGKKYRINGLALQKGAKWRLTIKGEVLPWLYDEQKTTFSQNVQAKAFDVKGSLETLNGYKNDPATIALYGKATSNHYEAYDTGTNTEFKTYEQWVALGDGQSAYNTAHKTYYQLYYQLRTLDTAPTNAHFEVTFTPMAPLAGYWTLSTADAPSFGNTSQGGTEGFKIVLWDGESELDNWSSGQIMNQEVTLRIYPSAQRDPRKEYCMLIKASFSPNKNGEPSYSADSELQDVHGDGRYSYWKFVIPATE